MAAAAQLRLFEAPARAITPPPALIETPQPSPAPTAVRRRTEAWLALHVSDLSLAAAYSAASPEQRAVLDQSPWAVVDDDRLKHIVACNALAWKHGVRPGHRMNAAI